LVDSPLLMPDRQIARLLNRTRIETGAPPGR